jgi:hypothetical protein
MTEKTGFNLSDKYRVFIDAITEYRKLRKQLLGHFVVLEGRRLRPSWGFYDLRILEDRQKKMRKAAADKNIQDPLLDVVTSIYPLEALALWIISEKHITAQDVKTLITLNDSLRRYWTQYNWIPTAVAAVAFFVLSELPHDLVKDLLLPHNYAIYSKIVLLLSIGIVGLAVLFLFAMFPITTMGGASLLFDQIEVLLKTCGLILGDPPNEMVLPASSMDARP